MKYSDLTGKDKIVFFNAISRNISEVNGFSIRQLDSEELQRDYDCYHFSGNGLDFVLKDSDIHEKKIYQMLNGKRITPRLSVPKLYEAFPDRTNPARQMIAMEFVKQQKAENENDGIIAYDGGTNLEAWRSAGYELARIHKAFWGITEVTASLDYKNTFDGILASFERARLIQGKPAIRKATDLMMRRFQSMPVTLVHFDLFPTNVLIKERAFTSSVGSVVCPQATIVDWQTAASLPYILDIARITAHCKREVKTNIEDLNYSPPYCSAECQEKVINAYYQGVKACLDMPEESFMIDYLFGRFFELLRMYYQMSHLSPCNSYDRYYCDAVEKASEQILDLNG